jgi:hypothetical protein
MDCWRLIDCLREFDFRKKAFYYILITIAVIAIVPVFILI